MEATTYLNRYRIVTDGLGTPVELRRRSGVVTYQAEDIESGREVAMEVFPAFDLESEMREELEREASAARELNHINIPALHAFGAEGDQLVYASEYFDGLSAEAWIEAHGTMPVGAVLRIALQVVNALGAAACHGIVHPAINPRNVVLVPGQTPEGDWPLVKILNLIGLAPELNGSSTSAEEADFASSFVSPEQLEEGTVDFQSEIYSLGATLWFLLTGAAPIGGAELPRINTLSKPVMQLLWRMLAQNPAERPDDPVSFEADVRVCLDRLAGRGAVGRPTAVSRPLAPSVLESEPYRSSTWRPFAVAAVFLALAALGALFVWREMRPSWLRGDVSTADEVTQIGVPVAQPVAPALIAAPPPLPVDSPEPPKVATTDQNALEAPSAVIQTSATSAQLEAEEAAIVAAAMREDPPPAEGPDAPLAAPEPTPLPRVAGGVEAEFKPPTPVATPPVARVVQLHRVAPPEEEVAAAVPRPQTAKPANRPRRINGLEVRPAEPVDADAPPSP